MNFYPVDPEKKPNGAARGLCFVCGYSVKQYSHAKCSEQADAARKSAARADHLRVRRAAAGRYRAKRAAQRGAMA